MMQCDLKIRRKYYTERIQKNELGFLKEIKKEGLHSNKEIYKILKAIHEITFNIEKTQKYRIICVKH